MRDASYIRPTDRPVMTRNAFSMEEGEGDLRPPTPLASEKNRRRLPNHGDCVIYPCFISRINSVSS